MRGYLRGILFQPTSKPEYDCRVVLITQGVYGGRYQAAWF